MSEQAEVQASPVVKVARDLSEIEKMSAMLGDEAAEAANSSLMPGGRATVALAPVSNIEAWEHQFETRERVGLDATHVMDEDDSWEPPLQTLCFWSDSWRTEHGAEYGQRPTIGSEVNFLRYLLGWAWDNEPHFDDFAADIRKARVRLEDIVHDGRRAERSRVTCTNPTCERQPRLIKVYGRIAADDGYKCPGCRMRYDPSAYARAMFRHLDEGEGRERHVKAQDARAAIDRSERTWSKWIRFWHVRSYVDPHTKQRWVWWPDVRAADLATQTRERKAG